MLRFRCHTANEGIERIDSMNESRLQQELQGAIDSRGSECTFALFQQSEYVIRANRSVPLPNELEDPAANGGQLQLTFLADSFGHAQRAGHAPLMIVLSAGFGESVLGVCHEIQSD
jgi:hypothetical protein